MKFLGPPFYRTPLDECFYHKVTLESRIIEGVGIIGGLDIVIIINNRGVGIIGRGGWTGLKK